MGEIPPRTERNVIHMRYLIKSVIVMAACVTATLGAMVAPASSHVDVPEVPEPQATPIWCGGVEWPAEVSVCIPPWGLTVDGNRVL